MVIFRFPVEFEQCIFYGKIVDIKIESTPNYDAICGKHKILYVIYKIYTCHKTLKKKVLIFFS